MKVRVEVLRRGRFRDVPEVVAFIDLEHTPGDEYDVRVTAVGKTAPSPMEPQ